MGRSIRIGATIGMIAGLYSLYKRVSGGSNKSKLAVLSLTGYNIEDGSWDWRQADAALPMVAGAGLSLAASKIGLNRYTPKGINI